MKNFEDYQELVQWLADKKIQYKKWGQGESKTIDNLWQEYVHGESSFYDNPPGRVVEIVQIIILRDQKILLEVEQEFVDGRRRSRNRPPSDKIKPGEDIHKAALRCLYEELGLNPGQITIDNDSYKEKQKTIDSPSYPGLICHFTVHRVKAAVQGLPAEPFWRENMAAGDGDPVQRHLWQWIDVERK